MYKSVKYFNLIFIISLIVLSGCKKPEPVVTKIPIKSFTLKAGDTLSLSLKAANLGQEENDRIIANLSKVFNPRYCKAGDICDIEVDTSNNWMKFIYMPSGLDYYIVEKSSRGVINSFKKIRDIQQKTYSSAGIIKTSLWEAMSQKGIDPELIVDYAEVFSWQIDFLTEPRVGDRYKLVWERKEAVGGKKISDKILGAQYMARERTYTAILFTYDDGRTDYYNIKGESLRRAFLRAPLQYRRISSFFSKSRYHPILKIFRPHLGIDYAAPSGTPVSSVGDGHVVFRAREGGFGNLVRIRHPNGYESYYGHLSHFEKTLRVGSSVRQGQLIGYVGATGLATGPHLDFRMKKDNSFLNYLSMKFPVVKSIEPKNKEAFVMTAKKTLSELANVH